MDLNNTSYEQQGSPIRVYLQESVGGLSVYLGLKYRNCTTVLHLTPAGWDYTVPPEDAQLVDDRGPSFTLPDDFGRAMLEALMRHYAGAQDLHTVRADLLHERARRDKMEDAMITIAMAVNDA